ncbi:ABC transporter permease [Paenibacillus paeoniae]|uniref:ABC transporter permease n=1 Tax=Paenibacillus paeoniae TaxID=2292705 RepID=A0A371PE97_9BACL|nr:ABC transporter permease [Paenibacillus paeoniae]REK74245.1 hypothetical protein DX130_17025 [Paenibacillus paeoniae]
MNLLRMEWVKFKPGKILLTFLLFNGAAFLMLYALGMSTGGMAMFPDMKVAIREINNSIVWPGCFIFAGVWGAKIFIQEFRNKTITTIWASGIHRSRLAAVKLILISALGILATVLSTLLQNSLLLLLSPYTYYAEQPMSIVSHMSVAYMGAVGWSALCIGLTVLLAVALGIRSFSTTVTIVAAMAFGVIWAFQLGFPGTYFNVESVRLLFVLAGLFSTGFLMRHIHRLDL